MLQNTRYRYTRLVVSLFCLLLGHVGFGQNPNWGDSLEKYKRMPQQQGVQKLEAAIQRDDFTNDTLRFDYMGSILFRYSRTKSTDSLLSIARNMLRLAEQIDDSMRIAKGNLSKSWVYRDQGMIDSTLHYAQNAQKTAERINDSATLLTSLNTLAAVYYDMKIDSLQMKYLSRAEKLSRSPRFMRERLLITSNLGYLYLKEEDNQTAKKFFLESDSLMRLVTPSNYYGFYLNFNHLSDMWQNAEDLEKAIQNADSMRHYARLLQSKPHISVSQARYHYLKIKTGENVTQGKWYEELKNTSNDNLSPDEIKSLHYYTMVIDGNLGNYKEAYEKSYKYAKLVDSLNSEDLRDKISSIRELYAAEQREGEILRLENENRISHLESEKRQSRIIALSSGFVLVLIAGGFLFVYNRKLNRAKQKLAELNETKDRFFAIISHDVRNATTAFQGLGKIIKKYVSQGKEERLDSLGTKIDNEADHLNGLLDNLLNWSMTQLKSVPTKPEKLELKKRTQSIIELFQNHASSKDIVLESKLDENIKAVADPNAYDLVMRNLVNNAIKFTGPGGKITITGVLDNDTVKLEVRDNGKGISKEKLEKLFDIDSKKTSKGTGGERGSGLGLVLCKEYLELNGGKIKLESEPGKGTTATIELKTAA